VGAAPWVHRRDLKVTTRRQQAQREIKENLFHEFLFYFSCSEPGWTARTPADQYKYIKIYEINFYIFFTWTRRWAGAA
jgi:hypothetical protein